MCRKNKSQAILTYAALIAAVAVALVTMFMYMQRRVQGSFKQSADSIGLEEQKN